MRDFTSIASENEGIKRIGVCSLVWQARTEYKVKHRGETLCEKEAYWAMILLKINIKMVYLWFMALLLSSFLRP